MKLWLTSSEIADLALPGMPETKRNVNALAEREDWARFSALCRQRAGRGGGLEYHVNLLPMAARSAYYGSAAPASTAGEALQAAPEPAPGTTGKAMQQLDARLAVLAAMKAFIRASEMKQTLAISYFVDLYNLGKIDLPNWALELLPRLATRTVLRWLSASREGETERLAVDKGAARRGQGVLDAAFDGEIKHFALADPPPLSWSTVKYVFWQTGGPRCRRSATSPKRSSRSCVRSMYWSRRGNPLPTRSARSA